GRQPLALVRSSVFRSCSFAFNFASLTLLPSFHKVVAGAHPVSVLCLQKMHQGALRGLFIQSDRPGHFVDCKC
ncbi:unnamed protein product, partial [Ectocarpus sp. 4 AP-2014]